MRVLAIAVPVVLLIGGAVGVTKGRFGAFLDYARGGNSYLGNAVLTERIVVRDDALLSRLKTDPDYEDYRRRHPDLAAPPADRITAPHNGAELAEYGILINRFRTIAAGDGGAALMPRQMPSSPWSMVPLNATKPAAARSTAASSARTVAIRKFTCSIWPMRKPPVEP